MWISMGTEAISPLRHYLIFILPTTQQSNKGYDQNGAKREAQPPTGKQQRERKVQCVGLDVDINGNSGDFVTQSPFDFDLAKESALVEINR